MKSLRASISRRSLLFCAISIGFALASGGVQGLLAAEQLGEVPVELRMKSIHGELVQPLRCVNGQRAAVLIFITTDCPIANRYAPELERLRTDFEGKGVKLTLVQVGPELADDKAREHAAQFSLRAAIVVDRKHQLVGATGATVTPEAVVVDAAGRIRYRGRIDDWFTDFGKSRRKPSRRDLRIALQSVLEGAPVSIPVTPAIGCLIPKRG